MTTRITIEDALYSWVSVSTGATTVFLEQGAPRPATPYMTVKVVSLTPTGLDSLVSVSDPLGPPNEATATYRGDREVSVSVQGIGPGAMDLCLTAANSLNKQSFVDSLAASGLFRRGLIPAVTDITALLETDYEERAQFDAIFALCDEYTDSVSLIETVEVDGTLENKPNPDRAVSFTATKP